MKYKYMIITRGVVCEKDNEKELDELGEQGWDLVGFSTMNALHRFVFKKRVRFYN